MAHGSACLSSQQDVLEAKCERVTGIPPQGELGVFSVTSLRRSVSQVMDGKTFAGDEAWDPNISGHDSGMVRDPRKVFYKEVKSFHIKTDTGVPV